ncbi:MAG: VCBS repeat-containing protein [Pirellulaceae bacterium]
MDLYVANDFGRNNLYRNDQGRFLDIAAEARAEDSASGMSAAWSDVDQDGWMDLYVGNMFSSAGGRVTYQADFKPHSSPEVRRRLQRFAKGSSLLKNQGNGRFTDMSEDANVTLGRWSWSSNFVDLNNDSRDDILVANGYITAEDTGDL